MRALLAATLLGLAGCSVPPSTDFPEMTEGEAQKAKMDLTTKLYSDCIVTGAQGVDIAISNDPAGSIANRVVLACKSHRNKLMAEVTVFHQIGHPKFSIAQSRAVAEASIATIEDELRRQAVVTVVTRQVAVGTPAPTDSIATTTGATSTGATKTGLLPAQPKVP